MNRVKMYSRTYPTIFKTLALTYLTELNIAFSRTCYSFHVIHPQLTVDGIKQFNNNFIQYMTTLWKFHIVVYVHNLLFFVKSRSALAQETHFW